jgi:hypothetical protein
MKNVCCVIGLVLGVVFSGQRAEASVISISSRIDAVVDEGKAKFSIELDNKGDETARNVRIQTAVGGGSATSPLKQALDPGEVYRWDAAIPVEFHKAGSYPVTTTIDYADENLHPYMAVVVSHVDFKERVASRVVGELTATSVAEAGRLRVQVRNLEPIELSVTVRAVVPRGLLIDSPERRISLESGETRDVDFDISNVSALVGSSYAIFAVLEHEDQNYHHASVLTGSVGVVDAGSMIRRYRVHLIAATVIMALVLLSINIVHRLRRQKLLKT